MAKAVSAVRGALPRGVGAIILDALGTRVRVINALLPRGARRLARVAAEAVTTVDHHLMIVPRLPARGTAHAMD